MRRRIDVICTDEDCLVRRDDVIIGYDEEYPVCEKCGEPTEQIFSNAKPGERYWVMQGVNW